MASIRGYLLVLLGSLLTYGGLIKTILVLGSIYRVLGWGIASIVGVVVIAIGTEMVVAASAGPHPDPETAPGKTDWLPHR